MSGAADGHEAAPPDELRALRGRRAVLTWGVFDGVHRGHQEVLRILAEEARRAGGVAAVLTFDRHPQEVLTGRTMPRLTTVAHRTLLLRRHGAAAVVVATFDAAFARLTADEFLDRFVAEAAGAAGIVLGYDARFGRDRAGDVASARRWCKGRGLAFRDVAPLVEGARPFKSSWARESLAAGDLEAVRLCLGRRSGAYGPVVRGDGRGRTLGFPTANVDTGGILLPPPGVYACVARLPGWEGRAVANIGRRPTFEGASAAPTGGTVEAHFLDYSGGDAYGETLELEFWRRLREERKFSGAAALVEQIRKDIDAAMVVLPKG